MEKHSLVAGPFGITLLYENGDTIMLRMLDTGVWYLTMVTPNEDVALHTVPDVSNAMPRYERFMWRKLNNDGTIE